MVAQVQLWRFTIADYERMLEAGILSEDDRVELIDGEVRAMSPIGSRHTAIVKRVNAFISRQIGDTAIVSVQDPIRLNDYTEPQPDIAVLRYREDFYGYAHPGPEDVLLVVEVAETLLEYDRQEKIPRYAQAMIPESWLFDAVSEIVTQYTDPDGTSYRQVCTLGRGQVLVSHAVSGFQLSVDSIFG
jgi:Uma2 family endonuclease